MHLRPVRSGRRKNCRDDRLHPETIPKKRYFVEKHPSLEKRPDKSPATADRYADVILPLAAPAMTFAVPDAMLRQIVPGCRVIVNWEPGNTTPGSSTGYTASGRAFDRIKPVGRIADAEPVATAEQLRLWHWLSEYYMCPLGMVLRAALPAGLKSDGFSEDETFGRGYMQPRQTVVSLHPDIRNEERLHVALDSLSRAKSQYKALLEYLEKTGNPDFGAPIEIPRKRLSAPTAILKALAEKGFIRIADTEIPASDAPAAPDKLPELSAAQTAAYEQIKTCFSEKEVVLLHGVTGSGKTEIYIRLMAEALAAGHNVLYMLPEIALTAQLIRRMESYFGKAVTVYHSRLSDNRRAAVYHELLRCDGGRIVIGVRSSVLLPLRNLSLVIVDEEHDTSFKQTDSAPRYHGRDTAVVLASVCGAKVLLGSATPLRRIVPQCGNRQIRTRRALGTLRRSHAAAGDRVGHAARRQTRRKVLAFQQNPARSDRPDAATGSSGNAVPEPAGILAVCRVRALRLDGRLPRLQRFADLP